MVKVFVTSVVFMIVLHLNANAQPVKMLEIELLTTGPSVDFTDFPDFSAIYLRSDVPNLKILSEISMVSKISISATETILIVKPTNQRLGFEAEGYVTEFIDIPNLRTRQVLWLQISSISKGSIGELRNPTTGRVWMDRNQGASQVATDRYDLAAVGDLYQWGRASDGHQKRGSPTINTLSNSDYPGHGNFVVPPSSPWDWLSLKNDRLWQGVNGVNNPCPTGFRLPTAAEWNAERRSWVSDNSFGAFVSLKLPLTGYRLSTSGTIHNVGTKGYYWSSTVADRASERLLFDANSALVNANSRAYGIAVRCIKN